LRAEPRPAGWTTLDYANFPVFRNLDRGKFADITGASGMARLRQSLKLTSESGFDALPPPRHRVLNLTTQLALPARHIGGTESQATWSTRN